MYGKLLQSMTYYFLRKGTLEWNKPIQIVNLEDILSSTLQIIHSARAAAVVKRYAALHTMVQPDR